MEVHLRLRSCWLQPDDPGVVRFHLDSQCLLLQQDHSWPGVIYLILDSGSSIHLVQDRAQLTDFLSLNPARVKPFGGLAGELLHYIVYFILITLVAGFNALVPTDDQGREDQLQQSNTTAASSLQVVAQQQTTITTNIHSITVETKLTFTTKHKRAGSAFFSSAILRTHGSGLAIYGPPTGWVYPFGCCRPILQNERRFRRKSRLTSGAYRHHQSAQDERRSRHQLRACGLALSDDRGTVCLRAVFVGYPADDLVLAGARGG
jgi:hypothetical protein